MGPGMRIGDQTPYAVERNVKIFGEVQGWNHSVVKFKGRRRIDALQGVACHDDGSRSAKKWLA
jgi:hypothetical protein